MVYKIADESMVDILVGSQVVCREGILPAKFDFTAIEILELSTAGPMARIEEGQLSVISPELIEVVI